MNWKEEFEKLGNLKTQEEKWTCDAGCGVDRDKIEAFIETQIIEKLIEEIPMYQNRTGQLQDLKQQLKAKCIRKPASS